MSTQEMNWTPMEKAVARRAAMSVGGQWSDISQPVRRAWLETTRAVLDASKAPDMAKVLECCARRLAQEIGVSFDECEGGPVGDARALLAFLKGETE
ncbi:hypothetical protein E5163_14760 [Marinicauda algicola]|uniref:Uncharacterized protein n=1 Tax=Marinicauda algicola TaxID=2029849 RepID=A0A4S2GW89_9PROT|nr:hypothetical protein [Marinicauda algicola]TGY87326.1 hypothetical protein E5163_14760 [Marinicauda algicola]